MPVRLIYIISIRHRGSAGLDKTPEVCYTLFESAPKKGPKSALWAHKRAPSRGGL